jgi:hypothetical protein
LKTFDLDLMQGVGVRLFGRAVFDQLNANHQAFATHIADDGVLVQQGAQSVKEIGSHHSSIAD